MQSSMQSARQTRLGTDVHVHERTLSCCGCFAAKSSSSLRSRISSSLKLPYNKVICRATRAHKPSGMSAAVKHDQMDHEFCPFAFQVHNNADRCENWTSAVVPLHVLNAMLTTRYSKAPQTTQTIGRHEVGCYLIQMDAKA